MAPHDQALHEQARHLTRRHFLRDCNAGLAGLALGMMMGGGADAAPTDGPLEPREPHLSAHQANDQTRHKQRQHDADASDPKIPGGLSIRYS